MAGPSDPLAKWLPTGDPLAPLKTATQPAVTTPPPPSTPEPATKQQPHAPEQAEPPTATVQPAGREVDSDAIPLAIPATAPAQAPPQATAPPVATRPSPDIGDDPFITPDPDAHRPHRRASKRRPGGLAVTLVVASVVSLVGWAGVTLLSGDGDSTEVGNGDSLMASIDTPNAQGRPDVAPEQQQNGDSQQTPVIPPGRSDRSSLAADLGESWFDQEPSSSDKVSPSDSSPDELSPPSIPQPSTPNDTSPTTSPDPATMPGPEPTEPLVKTPPVSIDQIRRGDDAYQDAMNALRSGQLDRAIVLAKAAIAAAANSQQDRRAEAVRQFAELAQYYRGAVDRSLNRLSPGDSIDLTSAVKVVLVESSPDRVIVRTAGRNKRFARDRMPIALVDRLAADSLVDAGDTALAARACFHSVSPSAGTDADRRQALGWLQSIQTEVIGADRDALIRVLEQWNP
ncbi:hypothetical protein [Crateriforma conspicua]|uniref:Uncharacterized protein n=1 Tax=Crateriforma conspicua TaxID=2527996 RepID=A0A5C5YCJ0_9PLAN|nr:hypothetical protein [Crateriforma conspicua]TWT72171.1 hypothetical protein Pan14r_44880 [Crateriforma conspicua]